MSLTTKPPAEGAPVRPDASPSGPARAPGARLPAFDAAAALRLLVEEIIAGATAGLGLKSIAPPPPAALPDARATATALLAWLSTAAGASGTSPERIAALIERAYARVLEILSRVAPGPEPAEASVRLARSLLLAGLGASPAPAPAMRAPGAQPMRLLAVEFERAVLEELGPHAPAPRPASGEEPGNVAAALLRWLRAVAVSANVPLARLRGVAERAIERTRESLAEEAAPASATEDLDKARDVLLAAIGREGRADESALVPTFRPDLPVTAPLVRPGAGRAAAKTRRPGPEDGAPRDEEDAAFEAEAPESPPAALDLKGPMELIRRYFEDFLSGEPGACAKHFVYPACRWQGGRWQAFADGPALSAAFAARQLELAARGIGGGKILMLRAEPLGASIATVRALVGREGRPGEAVEEVEVAYTTVLTPAGWRIAVLMLP